MEQFRSNPVRDVRRNASSLATGRTPGRPRQTGHTWVLGGAPNSLTQPHHIFDLVLSWTCVSSPITASYSIRRESLTTDQHGFHHRKVACTVAEPMSPGIS